MAHFPELSVANFSASFFPVALSLSTFYLLFSFMAYGRNLITCLSEHDNYGVCLFF
jgi:hypothetical protein